METETEKIPMKIIRCCLTCNASPSGHLRKFRNISVQYPSICDTLNFEVELSMIVHEKLYICDRCIHNTQKILSMRETLKTNIEEKERMKRAMILSCSPVSKNRKDVTDEKLIQPRSRNCEKQPFGNAVDVSETKLKQSVLLPVDHSYCEKQYIRNAVEVNETLVSKKRKDVTDEKYIQPRSSNSEKQSLGDEVEVSETPVSKKHKDVTDEKLIQPRSSNSEKQSLGDEVEVSETPVSKKHKDVTDEKLIQPRSRNSKKQLFGHAVEVNETKLNQSVLLPVDHSYCDLPVGDIYRQHQLKIYSTCEISPALDKLKIIKSHLENFNLKGMITELFKIPAAKDRIWQLILSEISQELDHVSSTKVPSKLRSKVTDLEPDKFFKSITQELHSRCPRTLDFLLIMCCPVHLSMPQDCYSIPAMYSMAMYNRNNHLGAFQKVIGAACVRYNSGNGLLGLLHKLGICIPMKSKQSMLEEMGQDLGKEIMNRFPNIKW